MENEYPKTLYKNGKFDGDQEEVKNNGEEAIARTKGYTEVYKFQEYPKSLHMDGDRTKAEIVVNDADAEIKARAEGYYTIHEIESGEVSREPKPVDPALAHLAPDVLAAVQAAGKDSVVGQALLAQFPAPASDTSEQASGKKKKAASE